MAKKDAERKNARARRKRGEKTSAEKSHNPFKYRRRIGPGPRGSTLNVADNWKCACDLDKSEDESICRCIGVGSRNRGQKKTVRIDLKKKRKYAKEYRAWKKKAEKRLKEAGKVTRKRKGR